LIGYASRTGTRRNLDALRAAGWRLLVSARADLRTEGFAYALDNGAWTAFQRQEPFDVAAFERAVEALGHGADWLVLPDKVAGGLESLDMSLTWLPRLRGVTRLLIAVQDGMVEADIRPYLADDVGVFVGGSTDWKLTTMRRWGELARAAASYCHVGRVNTVRRIRLCQDAGVDSFDGTSVSRFACNLPKLDAAIRQQHLFGRAA
jgi:hypothetical protein